MLGSSPATHWYRIHPNLTVIDEIIGLAFSKFDGWFLYNHGTDSRSVSLGLLGSALATQWYKSHIYVGNTHGDAEPSLGPGGILLDGSLRQNRWTDSNSLFRRLLGTPATRLYQVCPCRIKTQDFTVFCGGGLREHPGRTLLAG